MLLVAPLVPETCLQPPQPNAWQTGGCNMFVMQCMRIVEIQPSQFPSERAKISYMVNLLMDRYYCNLVRLFSLLFLIRIRSGDE